MKRRIGDGVQPGQPMAGLAFVEIEASARQHLVVERRSEDCRGADAAGEIRIDLAE
jgi:hypothetical protein